MSSPAVGIAVVTCLVATCSVSFAQTPAPERPYRALFGRGSQGSAGQSLDLSTTLVGAYDDNLLAEAGGITPGATPLSGYYTMLQSAGDYSWASRRVQLGITGASAFRYYGQVGNFQSVSHSAGIGLSTTLPKKTALAINQAAAYSPSYLSALFPAFGGARLGDAPPASPNYNVNDVTSYSYVTTGSVSHGVTRRGSVRAVGNYTFTDFRGESNGRRDGASYGATAGFTRDFGRRSAVSLDYRYRTGDFGFVSQGKTSEQGVDAGVSHTRVLSATRQAEFSFGLGASRSTVPPGSALDPAGLSQSLFRLVGNGDVAYQFSRTGEVRASYRRGVEYIVELGQPVIIDGVNVGVSGSPGRRLDLIAGAGYSSGASALLSASKFDTYTADVQSRFRLTRVLSAYLEYLYFFYDFGANSAVASTLPRRLERNGVRAGLTLSTPVLRK